MTEQSSGEDFTPIVAVLRDSRRVTLRAIRPDDEKALQAAFSRLSWDARRTRFMAVVKELPRTMLEHVAHPVPGRVLALVAIAGEGVDEAIVAGAHYVTDAANISCEFAITVTDGWRGAGLASRLLKQLIQAARTRGLKYMEGYVLANNKPMLDLARRLGFEVAASEEGPDVKLVRLQLDSNDNAVL